MPNGTDHFRQVVEVVKALVVASEGGHVLRPGREDEQRTESTGLKMAALRLPVAAYGRGLHVYQPKTLFQSHFLYTFLAFGDAWCHQHVAAVGSIEQSLPSFLPHLGVFSEHAIGTAVEQHLVFLGLAQHSRAHTCVVSDIHRSYRLSLLLTKQLYTFIMYNLFGIEISCKFRENPRISQRNPGIFSLAKLNNYFTTTFFIVPSFMRTIFSPFDVPLCCLPSRE